MDKSLDDIIASRPRGIRRTNPRRNSGKAQVLGTTTTAPATRARAVPASNGAKVVAPATTQQQPADKIIVSNLPTDVNEAQVKELFHTTVGPLKDVTLHYDSQGRSKGVAAVHFQRRGDGNKAFQTYHNRLIDGKRPMKIEIVVDPSKAPPTSLASRVAPAPAPPVAAAVESVPRTGGRPRRGRGNGRRKGGERTPKTVEDLDAEMEDYTSNNAPAAAA